MRDRSRPRRNSVKYFISRSERRRFYKSSGKIVTQSNNLIEIVKRIEFLKDLKQIKSMGKKYAYIENKIIYVFAGGEFLIDPTSAAKCELRRSNPRLMINDDEVSRQFFSGSSFLLLLLRLLQLQIEKYIRIFA